MTTSTSRSPSPTAADPVAVLSRQPSSDARMPLGAGHPAPAISGNATALQLQDKSRYRTAALHARRLHPGPVGELLHRELTAFAEFGYRFAGDSLIDRLVRAVLAGPGTQDLSGLGIDCVPGHVPVRQTGPSRLPTVVPHDRDQRRDH